MSSKTIASIELIKRIKPLLSDTPIVNASMYLNMSDAATITVEYMVTDELLKALSDSDTHAKSANGFSIDLETAIKQHQIDMHESLERFIKDFKVSFDREMKE